MNKAAEAARINVGESAVVAFSTDYETHVVNPPTSQGMKDGKPWYRYRVKINGETRGLFAKGMGEEDGPPHDVLQGKLMIQCREQGKHLASGLENATSEDARTIGTSLFIECNRKGITAESIKWEAGKPDESDDDLPF